MLPSYLRLFQSGGTIDTNALVANAKKDARLFDAKGIATKAGEKRLAAIDAIAATQRAGNSYVFSNNEDTHRLLDETGKLVKKGPHGRAEGSWFSTPDKKEISAVLGLAKANDLFIKQEVKAITLQPKKEEKKVVADAVSSPAVKETKTESAKINETSATPAAKTTENKSTVTPAVKSKGNTALTEKGINEIIKKAKVETISKKVLAALPSVVKNTEQPGVMTLPLPEDIQLISSFLATPSKAALIKYVQSKGGSITDPHLWGTISNGKWYLDLSSSTTKIKDPRTKLAIQSLWKTYKGIPLLQKGGQLVSKHQNNPVLNTTTGKWIDANGNEIDPIAYGTKVKPFAKYSTVAMPVKPIAAINNTPALTTKGSKINIPLKPINTITTTPSPLRTETDLLTKTTLTYAEQNELNKLMNDGKGWSKDTAAKMILNKRYTTQPITEHSTNTTAGLTTTGLQTKYGEAFKYNDALQLGLAYRTYKNKLADIPVPLRKAIEAAEPRVLAARDYDPATMNVYKNSIAGQQSGYNGSDPLLKAITESMAGKSRLDAQNELTAKQADLRLSEGARVNQEMNQFYNVVGANRANVVQTQNENNERIYEGRLAAAQAEKARKDQWYANLGTLATTIQQRGDAAKDNRMNMQYADTVEENKRKESAARLASLSMDDARNNIAKSKGKLATAEQVLANPAATPADKAWAEKEKVTATAEIASYQEDYDAAKQKAVYEPTTYVGSLDKSNMDFTNNQSILSIFRRRT